MSPLSSKCCPFARRQLSDDISIRISSTWRIGGRGEEGRGEMTLEVGRGGRRCGNMIA